MKNYTLMIGLLAVLLICGTGCGRKKVSIDDLPPDPAVCANFSYDENHPWAHVKEMAQLGCLKKLHEWEKSFSNYASLTDADYIKLSAAIITHNTEEIKRLLSAGLKLDDTTDNQLVYFLPLAISYGNTDAVKALLDDKRNVKNLLQNNAYFAIGTWMSPFIVRESMQSENSEQAAIEYINILVKNGFDVNTRFTTTHDGCTHTKSVLWSLPKACGKQQITRELENLGYQVSQQDKDAALFFAAMLQTTYGSEPKRRNVAIAKELLNEGANPYALWQSCASQNTYQAVQEKGSPEMKELFKMLGAKN